MQSTKTSHDNKRIIIRDKAGRIIFNQYMEAFTVEVQDLEESIAPNFPPYCKEIFEFVHRVSDAPALFPEFWEAMRQRTEQMNANIKTFEIGRKSVWDVAREALAETYSAEIERDLPAFIAETAKRKALADAVRLENEMRLEARLEAERQAEKEAPWSGQGNLLSTIIGKFNLKTDTRYDAWLAHVKGIKDPNAFGMYHFRTQFLERGHILFTPKHALIIVCTKTHDEKRNGCESTYHLVKLDGGELTLLLSSRDYVWHRRFAEIVKRELAPIAQPAN